MIPTTALATASTAAAAEPSPVLALANTPVLWICALGVFLVVAVQSVIYKKAARKAAPAAGMTPQELRTSFRTGAIAAIGPSLAVVLVAIALLALFGTPAAREPALAEELGLGGGPVIGNHTGAGVVAPRLPRPLGRPCPGGRPWKPPTGQPVPQAGTQRSSPRPLSLS